MKDLLVPPHIAENIERERFVDEQLHLAKAWSEVLREHDPRLSVVFINEHAHAVMVENGQAFKVDIPGIAPGRWHVRRQNDPPMADSYMPITGPDGEYREPDSGILFELQRRDMHNRSVDEVLAERRRAQDALVKRRELEREQMRDELAADLRAAHRMSSEDGFTKRKWGRR